MKFNKQNALVWCCSVVVSALLLVNTGYAAPAADVDKDMDSANLPIKDVQRFSEALSLVKKYYVEPISDQKLFEGSIRGMLAGLDPHSSYLDVQDFKDLKDVTSGEFSGLGIEVTVENGFIKVVSPIDDGPSQKVGIKPGDLIVRIDNHLVTEMTLREAVNKMRGKKGTSVRLTIVRKGEKAPLELTLVRDTIKVKSVKSKMLQDGFGYIRVSTFQTQTGPEVIKAINTLQSQSDNKLKGLVLDLRNNPGGLLDAAIQVADSLLDVSKLGKNRLIVYTKGRLPDTQFQAKVSGVGDILRGIPLVVLINEGSASASEIVAGALQDYHRAIVVGANSFGKGSVQTVLPLDESTGLKITTALYYTPAGRSIQAKGIVPDVVVDDLKIPPINKEKNQILDFIKESDLEHHLQNADKAMRPGGVKAKDVKANEIKPTEAKAGDAKSSIDTDDKSGDSHPVRTSNIDDLPTNPEELVSYDYQLFEALNVLKGLTVFSKYK